MRIAIADDFVLESHSISVLISQDNNPRLRKAHRKLLPTQIISPKRCYKRLTPCAFQKEALNLRKRSSVVQIIPNSTLQLRRALAKHARQVLQIIASGDAKLAHKVLCRSLQVAVVLDATCALLVFGTAEVRVGRDGLGAFEALQAGLGLVLCGRVVSAFAEELVGGDTFLDAELFASVALGVV